MAKVTPENIKLNVKKVEDLGIKKCRCNAIVITKDEKDPDNKAIKCGCKLPVIQHEQDVILRYQSPVKKIPIKELIGPYRKDFYPTEWDREVCTYDYENTDAFGDIVFPGASKTPSKYMRLSFRTPMEKVISLLRDKDKWNLKEPRLIISVTGGAKCVLEPRLKETFCKSLVKVATNTQSWVTSGGKNQGCMKLVGDAFKQNSESIDPSQKVVVLGICDWCTIARKESLIRDVQSKNYAVEYELVNVTKSKQQTSLLDPSHSHFLLVDDAKNYFGGELEFRNELETELAKKYQASIVLLVIAGGPNTLKTVNQSVESGTPCVFLESSGECASIFCYAHKEQAKRNLKKTDIKDAKLDQKLRDEIKQENDKLNDKKNLKNDKERIEKILEWKIFKLDQELREELLNRIKREYPKNDIKRNEGILESIYNILHPDYAHLVNICRPINGNAEVDVAILKAFLNSKKQEYQTQLKFAQSWNRIDIARDFIFTDENKDNIPTLDSFMYDAIKDDKVEFVELFLEKGFSLKNFLTKRVMLKLFNEIPVTSFLYKILENNSTQKRVSNSTRLNITYKDIGNAIEKLVNMSFVHKYTQKVKYNKVTHEQVETMLNNTKKPKTIGVLNGPDKRFLLDVDNKYNNPAHELFMYSTLLCRKEMAKLFCFEGQNQISSLVVATMIYKNYADIFGDEAKECKEQADYFESLALSVLQAAYEADDSKAKQTLTREIRDFDNCTTMQLAVAAYDLNIIAHQSFQNVLQEIWLYKIAPENRKLKIFLFCFMPWFAPLPYCIKFKEKSIEIENKTADEESLQGSNFNYEIMSNQSNFDRNRNPNVLFTYFQRLYYFSNAPFVKFIQHQFSYILFLILFSYVLLCDFSPVNQPFRPSTSMGLAISIPEIIIIIWVFTFFVEDIRQFNKSEKKVFMNKVISLIKSPESFLSTSALIMFLFGFILRFIPNDRCYVAARTIYCLAIAIWFLKFIAAYRVLKELGPKVTMIQKMIVEMCYFFVIIFLFMFAFGVSTQALMYPNQSLDKNLLKNVFFPAFFLIGGNYYTLDTIMSAASDTCDPTAQPDPCPDSTGASVTLAIYVIYLIVLNVLLVNLLVAIFNNTYSEIEAEANKIWKYQQYDLTYNFSYKPMFTFPLILISEFLYFSGAFLRSFKFLNNIVWFREKFEKFSSFHFSPTSSRKGFVYDYDDKYEEDFIIRWEGYIAMELKSKEIQEKTDDIISKLDRNSQKLDKLSSYFDDLLENEQKEQKESKEKLKNLNDQIDRLVKKIAK